MNNRVTIWAHGSQVFHWIKLIGFTHVRHGNDVMHVDEARKGITELSPKVQSADHTISPPSGETGTSTALTALKRIYDYLSSSTFDE